MNDLHDRMIDQLLKEILGGDRPRDMTARVMAQAKIVDRFRRRIWIGTGSAVAAAIAVTLGLILFLPHKTLTQPEEYVDVSSDGVAAPDDQPIQRGSTVYTEADSGKLNLGNYVDIKMNPQTALNIGGSKYNEKVLLNQGALDVEVTKQKGQFDVAVGQATVHVTGTKFRVKVGDEETATAWVKKLYVAVKEGSVEVQNLPGLKGTQVVKMGEARDFELKSISKSTSPGLLIAARNGAQIGNRANQLNSVLQKIAPVTQPATVPAPRPDRGGANNPNSVLPPLANANTGNRPVQILTTPGRSERMGLMQHSGDVYYLENREGNFYMFDKGAVQTTHKEWLGLPTTGYVKVLWEEGVVQRVERYVPPATNLQR